MKATELRAKLDALIAEHGDRDCYCHVEAYAEKAKSIYVESVGWKEPIFVIDEYDAPEGTA